MDRKDSSQANRLNRLPHPFQKDDAPGYTDGFLRLSLASPGSKTRPTVGGRGVFLNGTLHNLHKAGKECVRF